MFLLTRINVESISTLFNSRSKHFKHHYSGTICLSIIQTHLVNQRRTMGCLGLKSVYILQIIHHFFALSILFRDCKTIGPPVWCEDNGAVKPYNIWAKSTRRPSSWRMFSNRRTTRRFSTLQGTSLFHFGCQRDHIVAASVITIKIRMNAFNIHIQGVQRL